MSCPSLGLGLGLPLSGASGVLGVRYVAPISRIAFVHDSIGNALLGGASSPWHTLYYSYQSILRAGCRGFDYIAQDSGNPTWGHSGISAAQCLAAKATYLDPPAAKCTATGDAIFFQFGPNDISQGYTGEEAAASIAACWDYLRAAGVQVIGCEIPSRYDSADVEARATCNGLLRAAARRRRMLCVPWSAAITEGDAASFRASLDPELYDPVHPNLVGMAKLGRYAIPYLLPFVAPSDARTIASSNASLGGATAGNSWTPTGWGWSGTGGTRSNEQYVAAADGGNPWFQFDFTNTGADYVYCALQSPTLSELGTVGSAYSTIEIQCETLSGHTPGVAGQVVMRANGPNYFVYDLLSSSAYLNVMDYYDEDNAIADYRPETRAVAKDYGGSWTNIIGYYRFPVGAESATRYRIRNAGIVTTPA